MDLKDGFKWETLDKFKLKGNLEDGLRQVDERLSKLRTERNKLIAPGAAKVDLGKVFDDTLAEVTKNAGTLKYGHMGNDAIEGVKAVDLDTLHFAGNAAKLNPRLPANIAHWDETAQEILPAELLTIEAAGIELKEMKP